MLRITTLFLLLILYTKVTFPAKCKPKVGLTGCNTIDDNSKDFQWRIHSEHRIISSIQPGCSSSTIKISWSIQTDDYDEYGLPDFDNKPVLILTPFTLNIGKHILRVYVNENGSTYVKKCYLHTIPSEPIAVIIGGSKRKISSSHDLRLNGTNSIDVDCPQSDKKCFLFYNWTCNGIKFCNGFTSDEDTITIPKSALAISGEEQTFTVNLITESLYELKSKPFIQTLIISNKQIPTINLICIKNCPPTTEVFARNSNSNYKIICDSNDECKGIVYKWIICFNENENDCKAFQSETFMEFQVEEDFIKDSKSFYIVVKHEETATELVRSDVMYYLSLDGNWNITSSVNSPLKPFTVYCDCKNEAITGDLIYQLYEDDVLIATSATRILKGFFAAKSNTPLVYVKVHDFKTDAMYTCGVEANIKIEFIYSGADSKGIIETVNKLYIGDYSEHPSLLDLIYQNRKDYAIQLINILLEQVRPIENTVEARTFRKNFVMKILQDLMKFQLLAPYELKQLAGILKNLLQIVLVKNLAADRTITRLATALIKNIAILNEEEVEGKEIPFTQQGLVFEKFQLLLECFQENLFIVNDDDFEIPIVNVSTPFPPLLEEVPTENYPDYVLPNDDYQMKLRDYEESTYNIVDTIRTMGRAMFKTLASSRRSHWRELSRNSTVQIFKSTGVILYDVVFNNSETNGSMIVEISDDFKGLENDFGVIVTCFNHTDLLWWYKPMQIQTGIIDLIIYDNNNKQIEQVELPHRIWLNRYIKDDLIFTDGTVIVPYDLDQWLPKVIDLRINVTKVILNPGDGLMLHFNDLDNETFIDVVVLEEKRPSYEDFEKNATVISQENPNFNLATTERFMKDTAVYVGILPNREMLQKKRLTRYIRNDDDDDENNDFTLHYKVAFEIPECISWITVSRAWTGTHCKVGINITREHIQCDCYEGTTFAGTYKKAITIEDYTQPYTIKTSNYFEANYTMFYNVFFIFLVYCWACLLWIRKRNKNEKEIIFLADNLLAHRYGYLIIVRTGKEKFSGTTSKVFFKLKGSNGKTKPHVLNCPDPGNYLLQTGGEDWFVLATEKYLGDVISLTLWFDSDGCRASWYCENIEIYDLQKDAYWFFDVKKWFDVLKMDAVVQIKLKPFETVDEEKRLNIFNVFMKTVTSLHTWNLLSLRQNISYFKQITVLLSTINTCYFVSLVLYGIPKFDFVDNFSYFGHFALYPVIFLNAIFTSLLSFLLHFLILFLFRNKNILAWIICCITIISTQTLLIVHGIWLIEVTSMLCISSAVLALIFNIFILENCYIYIIKLLNLKKCKQQKQTKYFINKKEIIQKTNMQRKYLLHYFGMKLLRKYFLHDYRKLKHKDLKKIKEKEEEKLNFLRLLQEIITFGLYLAVLCVVVLANKDSQIIYSNREMESMLINAEQQHTMGLFDIVNTESLIEYINGTIIPTVHAMSWYHRFFVNDPGQMADYNNKFLGVVRIRQHRMPYNSCPLPEKADQFNQTCVSEFLYSHYVYKKRFQEGWDPELYYEIEYNRLEDFWNFQTSGTSVTGMFNRYPSGGYSAVLGRTIYNSYFNLNYLVEKLWFDRHTRLICLEFLIYNVNYNVFNSIKLVLEKTASGYFDHAYNIQTTRLLFVKSQLKFATIVFIVVFHILLLIIVVKKSYGLITGFKSYFKDIWNIIDLFIIVMSFCCIILFSYRIVLVGDFLNKLAYARRNEFISYDYLFVIEDILNIIAGLLVCITTIRLWKLLRFAQVFLKLERILIYSIGSLVVLFFYQIIIILGFGICGSILFGNQSSYFKSVWISICSLFYISLNLYKKFDYSRLVHTKGNLGNAYYIFFMFITFTIYTLYVTAIIIGCEKSAEYFIKKKIDFNVWNFLNEEFSYFWNTIDNSRFNESTRRIYENAFIEMKKTTTKVYAKGNAIRYENCMKIPTRKVQAMEAIVKVLLTTTIKDSESGVDFQLMMDVVKKMLLLEKPALEEKNQLFFITQNQDGKRILIDNEDLIRMEKIVQQLLGNNQIKNALPCIQSFEEIEHSLNLIRDIFQNINVT